MKLLTIIGTRPEAVKMAPILLALGDRSDITPRLCISGQHRDLLDGPLALFGIASDHQLEIDWDGDRLDRSVHRTRIEVDRLLAAERPDRLIVQGDTATAYAAALAASEHDIPLAHVEAGLRTHDLANPWPEEGYRRAIDVIADLLLAPTQGAARNLLAERPDAMPLVTGNSGIDALHLILARLAHDEALRARAEAELPAVSADRSLVLVTAHRRENLGRRLAGICAALAEIARTAEVEIVFPVHPNPQVSRTVAGALAGAANIHLVPPLSLPAMIMLMRRADLILTDSGGLQEEAPSFGTPLLILRERTERPEAVEAGMARLVGTDPSHIVIEALTALAERRPRGIRPILANPFGDGRAAGRIVAALAGEAFDPFTSAVIVQEPVPIRRVG